MFKFLAEFIEFCLFCWLLHQAGAGCFIWFLIGCAVVCSVLHAVEA